MRAISYGYFGNSTLPPIGNRGWKHRGVRFSQADNKWCSGRTTDISQVWKEVLWSAVKVLGGNLEFCLVIQALRPAFIWTKAAHAASC